MYDLATVGFATRFSDWSVLCYGNVRHRCAARPESDAAQTLLVVGLFVMRAAWYLQTSAARQRTLKRA